MTISDTVRAEQEGAGVAPVTAAAASIALQGGEQGRARRRWLDSLELVQVSVVGLNRFFIMSKAAVRDPHG